MSQKKLPHELSDEELIKLVQSEKIPVEEKHEEYENPFVQFLIFYNILPGNKPVTVRLLYNLFSGWSKEKFSIQKFSREISPHFKSSKADGNLTLLINKDSWYVSEKLYKEKKSNKRTNSKRIKKHFESFIDFFQLKPGKQWIEIKQLYHLYDYWYYTKKVKSRLSLKNFKDFCSLYFETKTEFKKEKKIWLGFSKQTINYINEKKYVKKEKTDKKKQE